MEINIDGPKERERKTHNFSTQMFNLDSNLGTRKKKIRRFTSSEISAAEI
jgi:hypothetical protein